MLVPARIGVEDYICSEFYDVPGAVFEARIGSGFDPDNMQHRTGSDGARYAIALAQYREDKDYAAFDAARDLVLSMSWRVDVTKESVRLVYEPKLSRDSRKKNAMARRAAKKRSHTVE